ncbi:hypothetical protein RDWZM_000168 [Blomia tropicalis]|uniref:Uncharacterized protein n=1 Tax=Blomia tropicalis TaxID=40697 RepID=A0A9Q0MAA8_BLOTA|nr:hypothetical protein RDWZM_000168 [Blomia tropicalis]
MTLRNNNNNNNNNGRTNSATNNNNNNPGTLTPTTTSTITNNGSLSAGYFLGSNFSNENYNDTNSDGQPIIAYPKANNNVGSCSVGGSVLSHHRYQGSTSGMVTTASTQSTQLSTAATTTTTQQSATDPVTNNNNKMINNNYGDQLEQQKTSNTTQVVNQKIANFAASQLPQPSSSSSSSNNSVLGDMTNLTPDERKKLEEIRMKRSKLTYEIQKLREVISNVKKEMSRLDQSNDISGGPGSKEDNSIQRAKQLSIGKKKFNMDPKKGIEFLVENNLLKNTPDDVARFLYKGEGLNKTAIGTYLGEKIDFNLQVLDSFIECHDFKNLLLVQALRQFLWSFRLPGEAQKIDRMMEKFAAHYCQQNPGVFSNTDTCFVLSFSIIMLNTSLHNPNVKEKMTSDRFVIMNRGINNGGDLPRNLLNSLYESIRQEPFKIPEDDGNDLMHTFFNPDREGWLWKQGGRYKNWKRRWFILNDKCLYYFEYTTDKEPRGIIPLENVDIRELGDGRGGRQHCFELYSSIGEVIKACKTDTEGRVIEGRHTVYRLAAANLEEKVAWVNGIRASVSRSPFYEMLAARKRKAQHNK